MSLNWWLWTVILSEPIIYIVWLSERHCSLWGKEKVTWVCEDIRKKMMAYLHNTLVQGAVYWQCQWIRQSTVKYIYSQSCNHHRHWQDKSPPIIRNGQTVPPPPNIWNSCTDILHSITFIIYSIYCICAKILWKHFYCYCQPVTKQIQSEWLDELILTNESKNIQCKQEQFL